MTNYRHGTNYYEILEVDRDAPQNEIHQAYQRAKATYSVDNPALYSMFSKEEARELTRMIEEAYSVLGNHAQRKAYDQSLSQHDHGGAAIQHQPIPSAPAPQHHSVERAEPEVSSHGTMPDFNVTEAMAATPGMAGNPAAGDAYLVRKREAPKASLPPGTGRTSVSTFNIDEAFESEIAAAEEWDGQLLKKIRTYKNVTLDQVSEATRISKTYLAAVENDDYASLPAPVFVRGFVVQLARILGLQTDKVANSYIKLLKAKSGR